MLGQAALELFSLRLRERELRVFVPDAVPKLFDKRKALFDAELVYSKGF